MKIGFPNNPRSNILKEIEWIGSSGFDFVDLFLEEDKAVPERIEVEKVRELLQKYNLEALGHTAWYLPIGSPMKSLRETAVNEAVRYFEIFHRLEIKLVTIHANWAKGMFSPEEGINFQIDTLNKLVREAENYNIEIMYEPIITPYDSVDNVAKILDGVPGLLLHIDTGHSNVFGRKPEDFIERFHEKLVHIHLNDNDGNADLHLPMGCGNINWKKTLKVLKKYYDGTITLEVFSRDKDYVLLSKEKLRKLWDEV